ncbi:hypothetical protein GCM10025879_19620 [Leuconostoc litchii]|nr:ABC transporter permease [Leuconostoc litchii]GMA70716.1 hypothetical protein GCM10025879_19620 [Leuconostoc litchii]
MKGNKLFWQRFRRTQRTNVKYFRLLFNDHFVLFLVILFGAFVLGYRELLNTSYPIMFWRSNWWQVVIIIWLLIGLHIGDLLTYFRPADRLYLLGNDSDIIKKYLSSAIRISIIYASIWQLIFIGVVVPLLLRIYVSSMARVVAIVVFIITYKLILLLYERDKLF